MQLRISCRTWGSTAVHWCSRPSWSLRSSSEWPFSGMSSGTRDWRMRPGIYSFSSYSVSIVLLLFLRLYFGENNIPGMFSVLQPLHAKMEKGAETLKEISFNHVRLHSKDWRLHSKGLQSFTLYGLVQAYGRDLAEANEWCKKYMATSNVKDLTQAWELYYHVFRRISKQLPQV